VREISERDGALCFKLVDFIDDQSMPLWPRMLSMRNVSERGTSFRFRSTCGGGLFVNEALGVRGRRRISLGQVTFAITSSHENPKMLELSIGGGGDDDPPQGRLSSHTIKRADN
jgi:hypothetical protein